MARGVNKFTVLGRVGSDPVLKVLPAGGNVVNLSIATSSIWKDKKTGEKKERTEWHQVVLFNRLADIAFEYAKKGREVYVEGPQRTRSWKDKQGETRYQTETVASDFQLLGSNPNASEQTQNSAASESPPGYGVDPDFANDFANDTQLEYFPDDEIPF